MNRSDPKPGLGKLLKRFARERRGVAAVEFALTVPLLLLLYMGSTEVSQLITIDQRVTTISGTMGDLVAQANGKLSLSNLNDYFAAANKILLPFSNATLKPVVTCVSVDKDGIVKVVWSEARNGATARTVGATYKLPAEMVNISKNSYVIVSEASYSYMPVLGMLGNAAIPLYHESFYAPRFGGTITITP